MKETGEKTAARKWRRALAWAAALLVLLTALAACDLLGTATSAPTRAPTRSEPTRPVQPTPTSDTPPTKAPGGTNGELQLTVAPVPVDIPDYNRRDWRHWTDEDRDCQNARQEALIAESKTRVTFESEDRCRVATGQWVGPYTGTVVDDPGKLDIDHLVPLANAHRSGGWAWDRDRKRAFANDLTYPDHLIATTASANRAKGSKGPEDWRPPDQGYWCDYAVDWVAIKSRWGLTATEREWEALQEMLGACPDG